MLGKTKGSWIEIKRENNNLITFIPLCKVEKLEIISESHELYDEYPNKTLLEYYDNKSLINLILDNPIDEIIGIK